MKCLTNLEAASLMLQEVLGLMEDEVPKHLAKAVAELLGKDEERACRVLKGGAEFP